MKFVYMKDDKDRIEHIFRHYEELLNEKHDYEIEKDEEQRNRLIKCIRMDLIQMGELVHHLSKETKSRLNPDDVSGVVSIRNIVVHGYSTIKDDYIWDTIDNYCPSLMEQLKKII